MRRRIEQFFERQASWLLTQPCETPGRRCCNFSRLFSKNPKCVSPVRKTPTVNAAPPIALPQVEIATLSLLAILQRFPADLKKTVAKMPEPTAMVALPVPTIIKQLPSGAVKMSLASVHRQAPPGTFTTNRTEEKRLVEVPLGEIFKRVKPELLKRRVDQRQSGLAEDGIDVFGDKENPYAIAPSVSEGKKREAPDYDAIAFEDPYAAPESASPPVLKMPEPMVGAPPPGVAPTPRPAGEPMKLAPSPALASAAATTQTSAASPANKPTATPGTPLAPPRGCRRTAFENSRASDAVGQRRGARDGRAERYLYGLAGEGEIGARNN